MSKPSDPYWAEPIGVRLWRWPAERVHNMVTPPTEISMPTAKPTYLGLLNAISVAESEAEPLFLAWADRTKDKKLAKTLRFVGMREGEHGKAFAKRMLELGYEVRPPVEASPRAGDIEMVSSSDRTDLEKFKALGFGQGQGETDAFDAMFSDKTIDPTTGALLGRYIAEERDSVRLLTADYERLAARAKAARKRAAARKKAAKVAAAAKKPA